MKQQHRWKQHKHITKHAAAKHFKLTQRLLASLPKSELARRAP